MALPSDRIEDLRKMGQMANSGTPERQEQISRDLAATFEVEEDPLIRIEIVRAAGRYRTHTASALLEKALEDSDPDVRTTACEAWGLRGGPDAIAQLGRIVAGDLDTDVRLAAVRALGNTDDPTAVPPLGVALDDRDPAMQYLAIRSLREVTGTNLGGDVNRWRQHLRGETPDPAAPVSIAGRIRKLF